MTTTSGLSGQEIPASPFKKKKRKSRILKFIIESGSFGNWDWYNEPKQIGKDWKTFYPTLKSVYKKYKVKVEGGKHPSFFHFKDAK